MTKAWPAGDAARSAYDEHAPSYERFLRRYRYEQWTDQLLKMAERAGLDGTRLLDVGCGTGLSFVGPLKRGFQVTGVDVSPRMADIAQGKVGSRGRVFVADMRNLKKLGEFDLVWAVNDAINYLLSRRELDAALRGLARNLAPDGLVLFDLNTLLNFRALFCERHTVQHEGISMTWQGNMQPGELVPGSVCEAHYTVEGKEGATAIHRQRHLPVPEVQAALQGAGLRSLEIYGELDGKLWQPLDEDRHTKAVYVARLS